MQGHALLGAVADWFVAVTVLFALLIIAAAVLRLF